MRAFLTILSIFVLGLLTACTNPEKSRVSHSRTIANKPVHQIDGRTWSVAGFGGLSSGANPPILAYFDGRDVFFKMEGGSVEKLEFFTNIGGDEMCLKELGDCYAFMPLSLVQKLVTAQPVIETSSDNSRSREASSNMMGPVWPCAEGSASLADCPQKETLSGLQTKVAQFINNRSEDVSHILVSGDFDHPTRQPKFLILGRGFEGDSFELRQANRREGRKSTLGSGWDAALDDGPAVLGLASAAVTLWAAVDRLTR